MSDQLTVDGRGCVACGSPIPAGSRSHRQTCSAACRQRASRQDRRESVTGPAVGPEEPQPASVKRPVPLSASTPAPEPPATSPRQPLAAIAEGIATPVDAYGPCRAYCEVRDGGFGVVFGRDAGRVHEPVGPAFRRPRQAIDLAELLNARLIAA